MNRVYILSQSRQGDREFFKSFCHSIAQKLTNGKYNISTTKNEYLILSYLNFLDNAEDYINNGLIPFLVNAIDKEDAKKKRVQLSNVTNVQLAEIRVADNVDEVETNQTILRDVARCIANIAHNQPELTPSLVDQDVVSILKSISLDARSTETILHSARAIANLSSIGMYKIILVILQLLIHFLL